MTENNDEIEPNRGVLAPKGENDLADRIREAIGADDDEVVEIVTPQFERRDGVDVDWVPDTKMDIYGLTDAGDETLKELGLRRWNDDLWLFPAEWYDYIPDGTLVEDINGFVEEFSHGQTDDDRRFGVLAYGIRNGENAP
jgi:hypothetical protein